MLNRASRGRSAGNSPVVKRAQISSPFNIGSHMRIALRPDTLRQIKAADYAGAFGRAIVIGDDGFDLPNAICETCRKDVYLAGERSLRSTHFKHFPGADCPSSSEVDKPYLALTPVNGDPAAGQRLRASFRANWQRHYRILSDLVPFLAPEEFIHLLQEATRLRTWEYRPFPEERIPYALILTADFPNWTSRKYRGNPMRELWLRFWYGTEVGAVEDLWIRQVDKIRLLRASYPSPSSKRGRPQPDQLLKLTPISVDLDFLTSPGFRPLRQWKIDTVERWFASRKNLF